MITVAIVDDEPIICETIKDILLRIDDIQVFTYTSVSLLDREFDFILLDIDMPDCDGIEFSKVSLDKRIIFVTNYDIRVKEVFGSNVYGYVSKSNLEVELVENVTKIIKQIKNNNTICFNINGEDIEIKINDIIYCQFIESHVMAIVYNDKCITVKDQDLKNIQEILNEQFVTITKDTIINKNKITDIDDDCLYLKGVNTKFKINIRKRTLVKRCFYEKL